MTIYDELAKANKAYAERFTKGDLPMPPGRKLAVVACMDARLDPAKALGLEEGDAHVIRNAGGRVSDDAIRSLVISQQLLGTNAIAIVHHTDCGMLTFTNDSLRRKVQDVFGVDVSGTDFLAFSDLEQSVIDDVGRVRNSPVIPREIPVVGYVYDVRTGNLRQVAAA
ncbi:MAG: beta-class carbonic anhydrase [Chloroflexota bacterium]